jgi:hypothetical protein
MSNLKMTQTAPYHSQTNNYQQNLEKSHPLHQMMPLNAEK